MPLSWTTYFKPNGDDRGCRANETLGWCCGLAGSSEFVYTATVCHDAAV